MHNPKPRGYWLNASHRISFMNDIVQKLNIKEPRDLFRVTNTIVIQNEGGGLLSQYGSISKMVMSMFPEYKTTCRSLIFQLVQELKLSKVEDLLNISKEYQVAMIFVPLHIKLTKSI